MTKIPITLPKRPLKWSDIVITSLWTIVLFPVWSKVMGPLMAVITTVVTSVFAIYCVTELIYLLDLRQFKKWIKENKDQVENIDKVFASIQQMINDTQKEQSDGSTNQNTGRRDCNETSPPEGTEEPRKEE